MASDPPADAPASGALARFLAVAGIALAGLAFASTAASGKVSLVLLDAGFGILRALGPAAAPDDIIVVGLDDANPDSPGASPAAAAMRRLPDILARVARAGPRAIALPGPLPSASLEASVPGLDDALATALAVAQRAAPFAIGITVDGRGAVVPIHERLLRDLDTRSLAFSLLPRDDDGIVRRAVLALPTQRGEWPTLAGWLCEALRGRCQSGYIDYALGPPYRYFPARRVLETRDDATLARMFGERIVFIAAVAGPQDRVPQPLSLAGWEPPAAQPAAVLAHAQTLRTLLHGNPLREAPLPAIAIVVAVVAFLALARRAVAPALAALALAALLGGGLAALRMGWFVPLAGPLATLVVAGAASRFLDRAAATRRP